jgi:hypothetical protein
MEGVMSALVNSRLNSETASLPVEVLEFLDVSACYLGRDEFPLAILEESFCPQSDGQYSDTEVQMQ